MAEETKDEILQEVDLVMKIDEVDFNGVEEYFGIMKMDEEFTLEMFLERFLWGPVTQHLIDYDSVVEDWEKYGAFTAMECITRFKDNQQKMMVAFKHLGPEEVFKALDGELIDEESITKTQKRTRLKNPEMAKLLTRSSEKELTEDDFEEYPVEYTDTYKLHRIAREMFSEKGVDLRNDVYIVEAVCPSTDHHYFLFVDDSNEQCTKKAIDAIAWTMHKPDGTPLNREEYLDLAYNGKES
ncbi:MAG: hypothetical protein P8J32_07085 [bacterium]|nr:hypothetical protein [bacterium]